MIVTMQSLRNNFQAFSKLQRDRPLHHFKTIYKRRTSISNCNPLRLCAKYTGDSDVDELLGKYMGGGEPKANKNKNISLSRLSPATSTMGNGVFTLLLLNFGLHITSYIWHPAWMATLALSHWAPQWWQFISAGFVHANWDHLLGNAFSILIFGRVVEEEEGAFGVWMTYLLCAFGGNLASYIASPGTRSISLGASSAVFGLFIVGVVTKLKPSLKRLLEAVVLGCFVFKQIASEVAIVSSGKSTSMMANGMNVGHVAHIGGALAGLILIFLLSRLPAGGGVEEF